MNGESKKTIALALVSFAIGAVLAEVFDNPKTRAKIAERSRNLAKKTKRLTTRNDLA
jgi:hypothetical protein